MYKNLIKDTRTSKGIGINELSRLSGVSAGYISSIERGEKENPSKVILDKLFKALDIRTPEADIISVDSEGNTVFIEVKSHPSSDADATFKTPEEAMKFILEQPTIMGYGGFDISEMDKQDIIDFANDLLNQLKILSYKYKK